MTEERRNEAASRNSLFDKDICLNQNIQNMTSFVAKKRGFGEHFFGAKNESPGGKANLPPPFGRGSNLFQFCEKFLVPHSEGCELGNK